MLGFSGRAGSALLNQLPIPVSATPPPPPLFFIFFSLGRALLYSRGSLKPMTIPYLSCMAYSPVV